MKRNNFLLITALCYSAAATTAPSINFTGELVGGINGEITSTCLPDSNRYCVDINDYVGPHGQNTAKVVIWPTIYNDLRFNPIKLDLFDLDDDKQYSVSWAMEGAWQVDSPWGPIRSTANFAPLFGWYNTCAVSDQVRGPLDGGYVRSSGSGNGLWNYCWYVKRPSSALVSSPFTQIYESFGEFGTFYSSAPMELQPFGTTLAEGTAPAARVCYELSVKGNLYEWNGIREILVNSSPVARYRSCGTIDGNIPTPVTCNASGFPPIDLGAVSTSTLKNTGVSGSSAGQLECDRRTSYSISILSSTFNDAPDLELKSGVSVNSSANKTVVNGIVAGGTPTHIDVNVDAIGLSSAGVQQGNVVLNILFY